MGLALPPCLWKGAVGTGFSTFLLPKEQDASEGLLGQVIHRGSGLQTPRIQGCFKTTPLIIKKNCFVGDRKCCSNCFYANSSEKAVGGGHFSSCPLEKWSAVVKISQWVLRHYKLSAENDCSLKQPCPNYPELLGLPSMPSNVTFSPLFCL